MSLVSRSDAEVLPPNRTPIARWPLALGAAVPAAILIVDAPLLGTVTKVVLLLLASACALDLVRREASAPGSPIPIACAIGGLFAIAVITPPRFSLDLWSYAMVGRLVVAHHVNPYTHVAASFPHDAFTNLLGPGWRYTTTPYGPVFVLHAALVAIVGGSHPLLYRVAFQGSAAALVGVALYYLWRETHSTSALALLGLHPVVACSVVNGGHNDAFVGLGLLLAVIDARRGHFTRAGWWVTAAFLVKVTAGLALLPLMVFAWMRDDWGAVKRVATGAVLVGIPLMLLTPGALGSLRHGQISVISRASIWNYVLRLPPRVVPHLPRPTGSLLGSCAFAAVLGVVVYVAGCGRDARDPAPGVVAAVAAWLVFGGYVLPWYTVWALPVAALLVRSRLSRLVAVQGAAVTVAFMIPASAIAAGGVVSDLVRLGIPIALAGMFLWAVAPSLLAAPMLQRSRARLARR